MLDQIAENLVQPFVWRNALLSVFGVRAVGNVIGIKEKFAGNDVLIDFKTQWLLLGIDVRGVVNLTKDVEAGCKGNSESLEAGVSDRGIENYRLGIFNWFVFHYEKQKICMDW